MYPRTEAFVAAMLRLPIYNIIMIPEKVEEPRRETLSSLHLVLHVCSQEHIDNLVVRPFVTVQAAEFSLVEPNILHPEGSYLVLRNSAIHSCSCPVPRCCA